MQRETRDEKLGIYTLYHRHQSFHYIELVEDFQFSLAYRAGLKNYDRIIELNGVNIEQDTAEEFHKRFQSQRHLPTQMLLCSAATYAHYKMNKKTIHRDLPTVKRLKLVKGTACTYT